MKLKELIKKILIIFGPLIGGFLISLVSNSSSYNTIEKPILSPPGSIFPIAWSILYLLMGISLYMVINREIGHDSIKVFILQLVINYIWPILFFRLKLYVLSAIWIILLIYVVIIMIIKFKNIKKFAGTLQIPYFIWLLFALYLNIGVALLN